MTKLVLAGSLLFIIIGFYLSYRLAKHWLTTSNKIFENVVFSLFINLLFGFISFLVWFNYAGPINEFLVFGGILLIVGATVLSSLALAVLLFVKRKKFYNRIQL